MHVGEFLFYNAYIPNDIKSIVDKYYSATQTNEKTLYVEKGISSNRRDVLLNYLINDDIQISANSSYTTLNEFFNLSTIGNVVDQAISTEGALRGAFSQGHGHYRNIFNYSLWDRTEPMGISLKIVLYAKTDALVDVVIPAYIMMSHASLDKIDNENGSVEYAVPGVSFFMAMYLYKKQAIINGVRLMATDSTSTMNTEQKKAVNDYVNYDPLKIKNSPTFNSKIFTFLIKGLVYLEKAYIKSMTINFSKHSAKTSQEYTVGSSSKELFKGDFPIWAELDVQIESLVPARSDMLWDSLTMYDITGDTTTSTNNKTS